MQRTTRRLTILPLIGAGLVGCATGGDSLPFDGVQLSAACANQQDKARERYSARAADGSWNSDAQRDTVEGFYLSPDCKRQVEQQRDVGVTRREPEKFDTDFRNRDR